MVENEALAVQDLRQQVANMVAVLTPNSMIVTHTQVYIMKEPAGKTRAVARVVLNDCLQLTGLRVVDGTNGLFVAYPNDPAYKGDDYRSLFYPVTRELRIHIEETVLLKYKEAVDAQKDDNPERPAHSVSRARRGRKAGSHTRGGLSTGP